MNEKTVRTGSLQTCCVCHKDIAAGAIALRRSRRAMTYYQRMHADGSGKVHWYHHVDCGNDCKGLDKQ